MSKTSTTFVLITLAAVLLSTVAIGSTSASSKVFSNSGNNIITKQNCIADGSCNLTSSNVITQQPSSTTPSPSPSPCASDVGGLTILTLAVAPPLLSGSLTCVSTPTVISGATITFTGTGVPRNLVATTHSGGEYFVDSFDPPTTPGTYTVQAHFAGSTGLQPSTSSTETFTVK